MLNAPSLSLLAAAVMKKLRIGAPALIATVFLFASSVSHESAFADTAAARAKAGTTLRGMTTIVETQQDLQDLAALGANFVRYQLSWNETADTATKEQYLAWFRGRLDNLDLLVTTCEQTGMQMVLSLHTPPGGLSRRAPSPHWARLFQEVAWQDTLVQVWQELATRYNGRAGIWAFDLLNEPADANVSGGAQKWKDLAVRVTNAIRAIDPNRRVVINAAYGNPDKLKKLARINVTNAVFDVHSYFPSNFRNQGTGGRPINVSYPKKCPKTKKSCFNRAALIKSVKGARDFQKKYKVPIMIGEFAAPRWAPGSSAVNYLRDYINIFEKYGWNWTLHAWREADVWSLEHTNDPSNSQKSATPTDRQILLQGYWAKNP